MAAPSPLLPKIDEGKLWSLMSAAEELGLRLELTEHGITWEAMPGLRHQELAVSIFGSIHPSAGSSGFECYRALGVYVVLPSRVVKRPDISIFCRRPHEEESFIHVVPEAVVEITGPDSEGKDLVLGPPLYLANGVKDVVVLDRKRSETHHRTLAGDRVLPSPATLSLQCGCVVTV
jgi:hypothetical protein